MSFDEPGYKPHPHSEVKSLQEHWWERTGKNLLNRRLCAEAAWAEGVKEQERRQMPAPAAQADPCVWTEDDDGLWSGPCGVAWQFNDAGPVENKCNFCPRCGGKIEPDPYTDEDEG